MDFSRLRATSNVFKELRSTQWMTSLDITSTREPNPVEARDAGGCFNSQSRVFAGRTDHQHLFSSSVGVWKKIHLYG
ncbi:hypothetical protein TNCV_3464821 [Trichonephila clavipes]|nr:hypothetical protein TNCV_3464821 [Trichonephila clavipes]